MAKFIVLLEGHQTVRQSHVVEATSPEEAKAKALANSDEKTWLQWPRQKTPISIEAKVRTVGLALKRS